MCEGEGEAMQTLLPVHERAKELLSDFLLGLAAHQVVFLDLISLQRTWVLRQWALLPCKPRITQASAGSHLWGCPFICFNLRQPLM